MESYQTNSELIKAAKSELLLLTQNINEQNVKETSRTIHVILQMLNYSLRTKQKTNESETFQGTLFESVNELKTISESPKLSIKNESKVEPMRFTDSEISETSVPEVAPARLDRNGIPIYDKKKPMQETLVPEFEPHTPNVQVRSSGINKKESFATARFEFRRETNGGRALKGGSSLIPHDVYVSETIVRTLKLQDGDYVQISPNNTGLYNRYHFKLDASIQATPKQKTINTMPFGFVEYDELKGQLYVERDFTGQRLKPNGYPMRFYIADYTAEKLGVSDGDMVELAWYEDDAETLVVRWRERFDSEHTPQPVQSVAKKEKIVENKVITKLEPIEPEFNLHGKHIVVVGLTQVSAAIKKFVQEANGTVEFVDKASNKKARRSNEAKLNKADAIIVGQRMTGHDTFWVAKSVAKNLNIPIAPIVSLGGKRDFLQVATDLLELENPNVESE